MSQKLDSVIHRNIYHGDVLEQLSQFPDNSIDCIITSPPYWQLRDYSTEGQWGLEKTPEEFLEKMKTLMAHLKRVLKPTGTTWINLGDTYSTGVHGITAKSRMGITEQFYLNCIRSGWIARNVIPWIKWNAMPQSIKDRFTNKWEYIYFFAKEKKYYFNLDAVRIQTQNDWKSFALHVRDHNTGKAQMKFGDMARVPTEQELKKYNDDGTKKIVEKYEDVNSNVARLHKDRNHTPKQDETLGSDGKPKETYVGFNDRYNQQNNNKGKNPGDLTFETYTDEEILEWIKLCRDNLSAWELAPPDLFCINPRPMPENHFATFPIALPQRILKCACPKETCVRCGVPKIPIHKPTEAYQKVLDSIEKWHRGGMEKGLSNYKKELGTLTAQYEISGYDTCGCNDEFIPGIVLDPFFGSGTTGIAAELEGLRWCGIELKEEYSEIARKRLAPYVRQECLV
jgi:DNA modification methylase